MNFQSLEGKDLLKFTNKKVLKFLELSTQKMMLMVMLKLRKTKELPDIASTPLFWVHFSVQLVQVNLFDAYIPPLGFYSFGVVYVVIKDLPALFNLLFLPILSSLLIGQQSVCMYKMWDFQFGKRQKTMLKIWTALLWRNWVMRSICV